MEVILCSAQVLLSIAYLQVFYRKIKIIALQII